MTLRHFPKSHGKPRRRLLFVGVLMYIVLCCLMVKESDSRMAHGDSVVVTGFRNGSILDRPTGLGNVRDTQLGGVIDGIPEWEKGIAGNGNSGRSLEEFLLFFLRKWLGNRVKAGVPSDLFLVGKVALDVTNAGIDSVLSLGSLLEGQGQDLGVLSQIPGLNLAACQLDAIDAGLLSGTDTHHHSVLGESHRVGLGVLDADGGYNHVANRVFVDGGTLGTIRDNVSHVFAREHRVVALLGKGHSVHLSVFGGAGFVVLGGFQNDETSLLFRFENG
mmetsp:Transcript_9298/g.19331  ORF Transcript_9298/g.19331 Transcript_9298/m.19331 type:complete len:275 (-) Transcript_9298:838-1662(-)